MSVKIDTTAQRRNTICKATADAVFHLIESHFHEIEPLDQRKPKAEVGILVRWNSSSQTPKVNIDMAFTTKHRDSIEIRLDPPHHSPTPENA